MARLLAELNFWLKNGQSDCATVTLSESGMNVSYHSSIHEEGSLPAELFHRQLQQPGLRDGPLVDVQGSLRIEERGERERSVTQLHIKITGKMLCLHFHLTQRSNDVKFFQPLLKLHPS